VPEGQVPEDPQGGTPEETRAFKNLTAGTMISHYRIVTTIGAGGMGVVYKAVDTRLDRPVALKFLPPHLLCDATARARFEHEARSASALNHPNITTIYEIDEDGGQCFIAMELVEGRSLREVFKDRVLTMEEVLDIALQIGQGLDAAHRKQVVHRDIKPDNIMVTDDNRVKVMDFGLAKLRGATRVTKTATTVGTLQYMSPEQAQGKDTDQRSDVFSFGAVLYEMITGRKAFRGDNEAAVINSILNQDPEPLARYKRDVLDGLQRIVDKALAKDREERYQHADEMVADLKRERRVSERIDPSAARQVQATLKPGRGALRLVVLFAALAAVVTLYIIFEPFRIEMGPNTQAIAQENSLAIMYFENMADPEDTDRTAQMVTALLITDLSESEYMRVVSRQRLYDILARLGNQGHRSIDKSVASEVAAQAGVKWILTGTVLQTEPNIVLTSEISDAGTGEIRATQRVSGGPGDDLFAVIDRLTVEVRNDMVLPEEAMAEIDHHVSDVTTGSEDAYRYYLEGVDLNNKYYNDEAETAFRNAIRCDTTFAMAYYYLSSLTTGEESRELAEKALEYSSYASRIERYYIESYVAFLDGDYEETIRRAKRILEIEPDHKLTLFTIAVIYASFLGEEELGVHYCRRVLEIDPSFKNAYNQMAYAYNRMDKADSSVWAINQYIALAPDEANPYDTRGDIYAWNGRLDEAIASYKKAEAVKPDFVTSTLKIGHTYLFLGQYARAESCYKIVATSRDKWDRCEARTYLATVPIYRGKFAEALEVLRDGLGADQMEGTLRMYNAHKYRLAAEVHRELGENDLAIEYARRYRDVATRAHPENPIYEFDFYGHMLALAGEADLAEKVLRQAEERPDGETLRSFPSYYLAQGTIAMARGDFNTAIACFEQALQKAPYPYLHIRSVLAEAYLGAGRNDLAVATLEKALSRYDDSRLLSTLRAVECYHLLGMAYEASGWNEKAMEQYETFLDLWKDADPGIQVVDEARKRLERLKASS
jgi:tetratricopeptide (TPR) repeat protein/predicted Ser/Thr protein kinase